MTPLPTSVRTGIAGEAAEDALTVTTEPLTTEPVTTGPAGTDTADGADGAGTDPGADARPAPPADPVKALIRQHHALCAHAVDPLGIAAGLEARGITDRTAAAYRHRDVFTLAEEIHARVERPRDDDTAPATAVPGDGTGTGPRPGACDALRTPWGTAGALAWAWLAAHALLGDQLLTALLHGRHGRPVPALLATALTASLPTALALACAVAPAAWGAHWFAARARHALATSRSLAEFAARVRPALLTVTALVLATLPAALWPALTASLPAAHRTPPLAACAAVTALGTLLFLGRLLAAHGLPRPAVTAAVAAATAEALATATLLAARIPGCEALRWPVAWAVTAQGPAVVPLAACAPAALALLAHAVPALSRASVHGPAPAPDRAPVHHPDQHPDHAPDQHPDHDPARGPAHDTPAGTAPAR
ncbi:hypothetical protein GCM10010218_57490 [Streptomyces mashuensis]|uniref:Integral membrane protein n=1 Tax=Streptomyces mashuensis TaxID=33904 RepID=A0A919EEZ7_9ACTN|nr:hypothetical protein [Streptomyces mashuensis]GHF68567.1 hypothetical protein GCM10010218_57490 [Streptomyces mashuensis]